ncbi:MAG TPA: YciI family protein [Polyangiaceae bacterium]|jgi:hypothetical protein|nr:YciI family protein [Polyangiaceae bacterium]
MKFLMTYAGDRSAPPTPEKMAAIGKLTAEMMAAGVVVMTGGLVRPTTGTHVRMTAGTFSVTDGPFAETKELIDGFALIEVGSRAEAVEMARRFMSVAGDGEGEILQVFEPQNIPH